MSDSTPKKPSRIQQRNRHLILDAALDVFSAHGFRGATLDQIAEAAGLSKPNILYYFSGKEEIHVTLLNQLMETWLDPLVEMDSDGDPMTELLGYVHRKLDMARDLPRDSRLFDLGDNPALRRLRRAGSGLVRPQTDGRGTDVSGCPVSKGAERVRA